jgi:hypothetical protein
MSEMDTDQSGTVSAQEFMDAHADGSGMES